MSRKHDELLVQYNALMTKHEIVLLENMWRRKVCRACTAWMYKLFESILPHDIIDEIARHMSPAFVSDACVERVASNPIATITYRIETVDKM